MLVLRIVFVLLDADRLPGLRALPAGRRSVERVERVAAAEELRPGVEDLFQHGVDPRVAVGGEAGRVPIVQSRIAPSGVATMSGPNSGAMVSTSLIKRISCGTLSSYRRQLGRNVSARPRDGKLVEQACHQGNVDEVFTGVAAASAR